MNCQDVPSHEYETKVVRHGLLLIQPLRDMCTEELTEFQLQMLNSCWPMDEAEL